MLEQASISFPSNTVKNLLRKKHLSQRSNLELLNFPGRVS